MAGKAWWEEYQVAVHCVYSQKTDRCSPEVAVHCVHSHKTEMFTWCFPFFPFHSLQGTAYEIVPPTFKEGLYPLLNSLWKALMDTFRIVLC